MLLVLLAVVTATFQPPAPAVGDLITIEFQAPVVLERSAAYEIVSQEGRRAVVRTFSPEPFEVSGTLAGVPFRGLKVPVHSVLKENDDLQPAPLVPPKPAAFPRMPFYAIGGAALIALATWWLAFRAARAPAALALPSVSPADRFRREVEALRGMRDGAQRWAALADATRRFLAWKRRQLSSDLTTSELLPRLGDDERIVAEILAQGDLEKFSRGGAEPRDFDSVAAGALQLIPPPEVPAT